MRETEFTRWLADEYVTRDGGRLQPAPQRDALSRCRRVERYEGDLDAHYARDRMKRLIESFEYSSDDARLRHSPAHSVPITGDVRTGTASLKTALTLYRAFVDSRPANRVR